MLDIENLESKFRFIIETESWKVLEKRFSEAEHVFIFGNGGEREVGELAEPGNVVILKSSIPHRVTPVTKGKRHSITLFYSGPKFQ